MVTIEVTGPDSDVMTSILPNTDVPTGRRYLINTFRKVNACPSARLILDGRIIASLYRDLSGTPIWR